MIGLVDAKKKIYTFVRLRRIVLQLLDKTGPTNIIYLTVMRPPYMLQNITTIAHRPDERPAGKLHLYRAENRIYRGLFLIDKYVFEASLLSR